MTPDEIDELTARLAAKPQDSEALAEAHRVGMADPPAYADLLEKVAEASRTDALAAHWLVQAAIVCADTLRDPRRAASLLREAVERAPKNDKAVDLLDRIYRENGKLKALATAFERRADALAEIAAADPEQLPRTVAAHLAAARIWNEDPLRRGDRALELLLRARKLDPSSLEVLRAAREQSLVEGRLPEVIQLYEAERGLVATPAEKAAIYRAEASVRRAAGDASGAAAALRFARRLDEGDAEIAAELAQAIHERAQSTDEVPGNEKREAADILAALAAAAEGDKALPLWLATLDLAPTHERALEIVARTLEEQGKQADVLPRWAAYVKAAPEAPLAATLRKKLAKAYEDAGRLAEAIEMTLALAAMGDLEADAQLLVLYERDGRIDALVDSLERKALKLPAPQRIPKLHEIAKLCVAKERPEKALEKHLEVLAIDAANATSLPFVEAELRAKGDVAELRSVLLRAARAPAATTSERKRFVRDAAELGEKLGDLEAAIRGWKEVGSIDRQDPEVRAELARLYEKAENWDDLVALLVTTPAEDDGPEGAIARLVRVAEIQEHKVDDVTAAAATWRRIAALLPGDVRAMTTAVRLFERVGKPALAADVLRSGAASVKDDGDRARTYRELGRLLESIDELLAAADAYVAAADVEPTAEALEAAERCFVTARRSRQAARAANRRAELAESPRAKAELVTREAELYLDADDPAEALTCLERAAAIDPTYAKAVTLLEQRYEEAGRSEELVALLLRRAEAEDREGRMALRKRAAEVAEARFRDPTTAAEIRRKVLDDGEDAPTLEWLAREAEARDAIEEALAFLERLGAASPDASQKARILLDEARLFADALGDVEGAIARYERVLRDYDGSSRPALDALASLEERRDNPRGVAAALERALELADGPERTRALALRLGDLYEGPIDEPARALEQLDVVASIDPGDRGLLLRRATLAERVGDMGKAATLWAEIAAGEEDPAHAHEATRKLAALYAGPLGRPVDALAVLAGPADAGDLEFRAAWLELADRLGEKAAAAARLEAWSETTTDADVRAAALRGAFERRLAGGELAEAARVARALAEVAGADGALAGRLAEAALAAKDAASLEAAHALAAAGLDGEALAKERVRQLEEVARAGLATDAARDRAELALAPLPGPLADALVARIATLLPSPAEVADLYHRQAERALDPEARAMALARAADVAAGLGDPGRAARALAAAVASADGEAAYAALERAATEADTRRGERALRGALAGLFAAHAGAPSVPEPRGATLLRRAAVIAARDLGDLDRAVAWLGDALALRQEAALERHARALDARLEELARIEQSLRALVGAAGERLPLGPTAPELEAPRFDPKPAPDVARPRASEPALHLDVPSAPPPPASTRSLDRGPSSAGVRPPTDRPPTSSRAPRSPTTPPPPWAGRSSVAPGRPPSMRPAARTPSITSLPTSTPPPPPTSSRPRASAPPPASRATPPAAPASVPGPPIQVIDEARAPLPSAPEGPLPSPPRAPSPSVPETPMPIAVRPPLSSAPPAPKATIPPATPTAPSLAAAPPIAPPNTPSERASEPPRPPLASRPDAPPAPATPTPEPAAATPPVVVAPTPAPAPTATPLPVSRFVPPPPRSVPRLGRRLTADELVDALFESVFDLELCDDAFGGAEFMVDVAMRKLGGSLAIVHLYDINKREFLVAAAAFSGSRWPSPPDLRKLREAEIDPLLAEAMRSDDPILVVDAATDKRLTGRRFQWLPHLPRTVLTFGVRQAGRYLGAIEICDPLDGGRFSESDAYALAYVGEHFARFLAARGIVVG
jgi:hypothetical protein